MTSNIRAIWICGLTIAAFGSAAPHAHGGMTPCNPEKIWASDGVTGDVFGSAVAIDGDTIVISAYRADGPGGADQGAVYVFRWSGLGWAQEAKLLASDGAANDNFGGPWTSVAIHADTIVVGAPNDDGPAGQNQGSAYIFVRQGTVWTQQAKLTATDPHPSDNFGSGVAIDGHTVVVGAPGYEGSQSGTGAAYVFTRSDTTWFQCARLDPHPNPTPARFGSSVDLEHGTLVVGAAPVHEVYIFNGAGDTWTETSVLQPSNADHFGFLVSLSGDHIAVSNSYSFATDGSVIVFARDGDPPVWTEEARLTPFDAVLPQGFANSLQIDGDTLIVGIWNDPDDTDGGVAYTYRRTESGWRPHQRLNPPEIIEPNDRFGWAVATEGGTAVVSAILGDAGARATDEGAVWVFSHEDGSWLTGDTAMTQPDGPAEDAEFGHSVAVDGNQAIIGAPGTVGLPGDTDGAAYVVRAPEWGQSWESEAKLTVPDIGVLGGLGTDVAIDGDTALVSAPLGGSTSAGFVAVFVRDETGWQEQTSLELIGGLATDSFGSAVDLQGDDAVVGAPGRGGPAGGGQGAAYVYHRDGASWVAQALIAPDATALDAFGISVSIHEDRLVVGTSPSARPGGAYVFVRAGSTWTFETRLEAWDGHSGDGFGRDVAICGPYVIVGASLATTPLMTGAAYVFRYDGAAWSPDTKIVPDDALDGDHFGSSVDISGDHAIVGAHDAQTAYIFRKSGTDWLELARYSGPYANFSDAVAIDAGVAVLGDPRAPFAPLSNCGRTYFHPVLEGCMPAQIVNADTGVTYTSLPAAITDASSGDTLLANSKTFGTDDVIDTSGTSLTIRSSGIVVQPHDGLLILSSGTSLTQPPTAAARLFGSVSIDAGASFEAGSELLIGDQLAFTDATITCSGPIDNRGLLTGWGTVWGDVSNEGCFEITASTYLIGDLWNRSATTVDEAPLAVFGSVVNDGSIVITEGILAILGDLTNNGTISGSYTVTPPKRTDARTMSDAFDLIGELHSATGSTIAFGNARALIEGGVFDVAINDPAGFDMVNATLSIGGVGDTLFEVMSTDEGLVPEAFEPGPGRFPIGTLEVFQYATLHLIDAHDNDAQGQATSEALYASELIVPAGATLNTDGRRVYALSATILGVVDDPENVIVPSPPCLGDLDGDGSTTVFDFGIFAANFGQTVTPNTLGDFDGDGIVTVLDFAIFAADFGCTP